MQTRLYKVVPRIPERLSALKNIAYNLWWTWNPDAVDLFRSIDSHLWEETLHNPVLLLGRVDQKRLEELSSDSVYLSNLDEVAGSLEDYLGRPTWFDKTMERRPGGIDRFLTAFFSMEFGLHESLPIYSGGLGVLAGDTLKSASELGLPLVGVSLLYRQGYFGQYLNSDGWQQERYFVNDYSNTPVSPVLDNDGRPVVVTLPLNGRDITAAVWMVRVGRTRLYLLDTDLPVNSPKDREITGHLYGGDREMRLKQEIVLGIGGLRVLEAIGSRPSVCHANEGHSAFLVLERIRQLMGEGLSLGEARELAIAGNVFTTHTPVLAGNDEFPPELLGSYLKPYLDLLGMPLEAFIELGRTGGRGDFSMTIFALRHSRFRNGVSRLHGKVSRSIWKSVWPGLSEDDIPIEHVTNGVHIETWMSDEMTRLLDRYIGPRWPSNPRDEACWRNIADIPDSELWRGHVRLRERLVAYVRERWRAQQASMGLTGQGMSETPVLNPDVLTIGFARRFATYKRATLLLRDPERLAKLLGHPDRPIQLVFAGKAHPHDDGGKELIRQIVHQSMKEGFYGRMVYLEDYSMDMARHFVQGVDVWLNVPRRPLEASGTSGMKASLNGVLNCSVPDGWWDEAYSPGIGWLVGRGETYSDPETQDRVETKALYDMIENVIAPLFYDRQADGLPRGWISMMKNCMRTICPFFNTNRMLAEYSDRYYIPAFDGWEALAADSWAGAKELSAWKDRIRSAWRTVRVERVESPGEDIPVTVGDVVPVKVVMYADGLEPGDLSVEIRSGLYRGDEGPEDTMSDRMSFNGMEDGRMVFSGSFACTRTGTQGFTVRVLPSHRRFGTIVEPGLVAWWT
ncbi:MAG TPA: alpha-glucan family phosphorylase [Candidatus Fermentibacter daniensis]|nr:alpha-glucan family phosphorylase [Candidatus Fermentibacter daniensis]HOR07462.1 alpha-glucan family phosphorylase [Candidatus Fermentibacter daniensis]HPK52528.1 alpha-glucan family phosphorylase [Candidatus Fermentibacter daniensis]